MGILLRLKDGCGIVIAIATTCFAISAYAQQPPDLHRVQAVVDGVRSPQHAWQADSILSAQPGIVISRTDYNTRNLMLHLQPACGLQEAEVEALLLPLGMSLRCWHRAPITAARFEHLDPRSCGEPTLVR